MVIAKINFPGSSAITSQRVSASQEWQSHKTAIPSCMLKRLAFGAPAGDSGDGAEPGGASQVSAQTNIFLVVDFRIH
jgi:hypothetical protein